MKLPRFGPSPVRPLTRSWAHGYLRGEPGRSRPVGGAATAATCQSPGPRRCLGLRLAEAAGRGPGARADPLARSQPGHEVRTRDGQVRSRSQHREGQVRSHRCSKENTGLLQSTRFAHQGQALRGSRLRERLVECRDGCGAGAWQVPDRWRRRTTGGVRSARVRATARSGLVSVRMGRSRSASSRCAATPAVSRARRDATRRQLRTSRCHS